MYKRILVPVDPGDVDTAKEALDTGVSLAKSAAGELRVIYVRHPISGNTMAYFPADFEEKLQEWAASKIANIANGIDLPQEQLSTRIRIGGSYQEILTEAREWSADLIVIGSHQPAMSTYLLGSTAASVVRHATCSVLVVRRPNNRDRLSAAGR